MKIWKLLIVFATFVFVGCGKDDGATGHEGHDHGEHAKAEEGSGSHLQDGSHKQMDQAVYFVEPVNGAKVKSPFKVVFGIKGMEVKPAGTMAENTGHHHLLINKMAMDKGEVIPADEKHLHFGAGQTETEVKLEPGEYILTMQFANGMHQSFGPMMSSSIKVTVE